MEQLIMLKSSTCKSPSFLSSRSVWKLLRFGENTVNSYNDVQPNDYYINALLEYVKSFNSRKIFFFLLRTVTSICNCLLRIIIIIYSFRVFHISVSGWFFTEVWVTASLLKFPLLLFTHLEFFTSILADGFSLKFEWQQVSSSLQDSSQYSGRPQQCCRLDSLYPSAYFQVLQAV